MPLGSLAGPTHRRRVVLTNGPTLLGDIEFPIPAGFYALFQEGDFGEVLHVVMNCRLEMLVLVG
jgi:hypothetical protein